MKFKSLIIYSTFFFFFQVMAVAQNVTTIAGNATRGYTGDSGPALSAQLNKPLGIAIDPAGNIFFTDTYNNVIRKINPMGIITTVAGTGIAGYSGDGGLAVLARLHNPNDLAFDNNGDLYICDSYNSVIRKITPAGIISTIAGTGIEGYSGDGGPAILARLRIPNGIFIDRSRNLYIADAFNHVARKVSSSGIISTIAGKGTEGYTGDNGAAILAQLRFPTEICVDNTGNILIGDHNSVIRKVSNSGIISTVAGTGAYGYSGDGGMAASAQLTIVTDINFDYSGNMFIADVLNNVIRKINTAGIITTIAGNGMTGYSGDGGPVLAARFNFPARFCLDNTNNLYIADSENDVIRKTKTCSDILTSSVSIAASAITICAKDSVSFTAIPDNGGTSPFYQWKINGRNTGINSNLFTTREISNGDIMSCIMTSSLSCTIPVSSTNTITITVKPGPDVRVMPDVTIPIGSSVQITAAVTGAVREYLWTPAAGLSNTSILSPVAAPGTTTMYYLRVTGINGCAELDSITIHVYKKFFMPTAFTPNNDGLNDLFRIPTGTSFDLKDFSVYNRWGSLVFKTKNINRGWDGKFNGFFCDTGIYVFTLSGKDEGKEISMKGTVLLVR